MAYVIRQDSDQTVQTCRLIGVFAGCTRLIVSFVMCWLIYTIITLTIGTDRPLQTV